MVSKLIIDPNMEVCLTLWECLSIWFYNLVEHNKDVVFTWGGDYDISHPYMGGEKKWLWYLKLDMEKVSNII